MEFKSWLSHFTPFSHAYLQVKLNVIIFSCSKYVIQILANDGKQLKLRHERSFIVYYQQYKNLHLKNSRNYFTGHFFAVLFFGSHSVVPLPSLSDQRKTLLSTKLSRESRSQRNTCGYRDLTWDYIYHCTFVLL